MISSCAVTAQIATIPRREHELCSGSFRHVGVVGARAAETT